MRPIITLLTDFGLSDTYVGQMKGVLLSRCPDCQIVDITHQVPPQDVQSGARMLAESVPYFPVGSTHIAVVDPGVGTGRRILAVRLAQQTIVLPDNGLITEVWHWANSLDSGQRPRSWQVTNSQLWLHSVSSTFHGRDVMSPVAAFLASGGDIHQVGPAIESVEMLDPIPAAPQLPDGFWRLKVVCIDHFGNLCLSGSPDFSQRVLGEGTWPIEGFIADIRLGSAANPSGYLQITARVVRTYGQAKPGETVILLDSQGRLELAVVNGSAEARSGLEVGSYVELRFRDTKQGQHEANLG